VRVLLPSVALIFSLGCAAPAAFAQTAASPLGPPRIGIVDFYGRSKVSEPLLRKALGFGEGDALPRSKEDVEEAVEAVKDVVSARLQATCCEDGKAILYVGIEERGAPHFDYLAAPSGEPRLSGEIRNQYAAFLRSVQAAIREGKMNENLAQGHSLMEHAGAYANQLRFAEIAQAELPLLRQVLRESGNEEHRAIAAYIIGYAPNKNGVTADLQSALRDPDDTVRNNAMRALGAIAVLAAKEPERGLQVSPTWFIEALDSLIWQDRTTAAATLVTLTEGRPANVIQHLKERAVPTLTEMARWKHLPHALPAFILLGRVLGEPEEEIQKAWSEGRRDALLAKLAPPPSSGKKK